MHGFGRPENAMLSSGEHREAELRTLKPKLQILDLSIKAMTNQSLAVPRSNPPLNPKPQELQGIYIEGSMYLTLKVWGHKEF